MMGKVKAVKMPETSRVFELVVTFIQTGITTDVFPAVVGSGSGCIDQELI